MTVALPYARIVAALGGALVLTPAFSAERFVGGAYGTDSGTLLYREVHVADRDQHVILYQCPDGRIMARKILRNDGSLSQPGFEFMDGRTGRGEGVHSEGGRRVVYVREPAGKTSTHPVPSEPQGVIDAGFDPYVRSHWAELGKGPATVPFLIADRGRFYPVKVTASEMPGGLRRITMRLDAWWGFATPTISVMYTEATKQLRRYEGPGTVRDAKGKPISVRIEFLPSDRQADVPADAIASALALPLDGRCAD